MKNAVNRNVAKHWFAIRTRPGAQSMAAAISGPDFPERRRGESNVERSLRKEGIDVYMPAFWIEYQNRRTHKVVQRRLPLLTGYAFVNISPSDFERVRLTDGVLCFLRMTTDTGPQPFPEREISALMLDEFKEQQKTRLGKHVRDEEVRLGRIEELTRTLKRGLPKGRAVRINLRARAEQEIQKMEGPAKERVVKILAELDALTGDPAEEVMAA